LKKREQLLRLLERDVPAGASVLLVLGVTAASLTLSNYLTFLATSAAIVGIVAMSVGLLAGQAGLASMCQMSFFGVGAWRACWLNLHLPSRSIQTDAACTTAALYLG
jgi:ABC-type branched-subunit amino acid transport system permease subunit